MTASQIISELKATGSPEKATHLSRFFKTGKGQYGEGDLFLGVTVPQQRNIAQKYGATGIDMLKELIRSPFHEARLTALLILVSKYEKEKKEELRQTYVDFYCNHAQYINNWDLVDLSCYKILGHWLSDKDRSILYEWAACGELWKQRISIVTCMYFVRTGDFNDCMAISDLLINHPHDLIHKAVGWLLREMGKKDRATLTAYLKGRYKTMPRTMLRYAIEHFPEEERKKYLNSEV